MEHPADPGVEPSPSIWSTEKMQGLEFRCNAIRLLIHQCMFGGRARKDIFLSGTLDGLDMPAIVCDEPFSLSLPPRLRGRGFQVLRVGYVS